MPGYIYHDDNSVRQYADINVVVLDAAQAEKLGHVRWINEANPVTSIRSMVAAIAEPGINCAVWPQAGQSLSQKGELLRAWDAGNRLGHAMMPIYTAETDIREFQQELGGRFSKAAALAEDAASAQAVNTVGSHVSQRISLFRMAIDPASIISSIRFSSCQDTSDDDITPHAHTDSTNGEAIGFRFIEAAAGKTTHIFSNSAALGVEGRRRYNLLREGQPVTAYAMPDGAMVLVTNEGHPGQSVLHGEPWGKEDEKRILSVYTLKLRQPYTTGSDFKPA